MLNIFCDQVTWATHVCMLSRTEGEHAEPMSTVPSLEKGPVTQEYNVIIRERGFGFMHYELLVIAKYYTIRVHNIHSGEVVWKS